MSTTSSSHKWLIKLGENFPSVSTRRRKPWYELTLWADYIVYTNITTMIGSAAVSKTNGPNPMVSSSPSPVITISVGRELLMRRHCIYNPWVESSDTTNDTLFIHFFCWGSHLIMQMKTCYNWRMQRLAIKKISRWEGCSSFTKLSPHTQHGVWWESSFTHHEIPNHCLSGHNTRVDVCRLVKIVDNWWKFRKKKINILELS